MAQVTALPALSNADISAACQRGMKWIIVDNTVLDVGPLIDDKDGAHKGGNVFSIGRDNTHLFHELHANLPEMSSAHRPDLPSITAHIQEKVRKHAVGIIQSRRHETPLTDPKHKFWTPTQRRPPYLQKVSTSMAACEQCVEDALRVCIDGLEPNSPKWRAFWAVVGVLVADAAAQPTHWNYKVTYYHDQLKRLNRWDSPEFVCPSLNAYYQVPCGSNSCFGDQAWLVLESLARCGKVNTGDLIEAHVQKFGPQGVYGPLGSTNVQSAGDLPISRPWRHGSLDRFLRNVNSGATFPQCGSNDGSSDCFVKAVPAIALFAGHPGLKASVSDVVRVTQNNSTAVGYACAAASILEQIILHGCHGADALRKASEDMLQSGHSIESHIGTQLADLEDLTDMPFLEGVKVYSGGHYNAVSVS
eukprot:TRINITY_DN52628_c0_g1_i1.p1 TRINITY_DN52628_c0_g1~~TRINITY_DN52628_c0_g1_i1.p1  ORF type:complete len:417 (+),score=52.83 TRINITY_DN52628_c0_g1_i1:49-1299(+)